MADPKEMQCTVGTRCVCEGYYGTIRYVGEVQPTSGVWLGVEWDDPVRGKHSGEHEGVCYFKTKTDGTGSFVRPKKVSLGCSFVEALKQKYGQPVSEDEIFISGQSVEMVRPDKITKKHSEYDQLCDISLRDKNVSCAGPKGEIAATTPNIQSLNLSCCLLLSSWETVANISSQLSHLTSLHLSENIALDLFSDNASGLAPAFQSIRVLYVNRMALVWSKVVVILRMMPWLEELHVCENKINTLQCDDVDGGGEDYMPKNLQLLNLEMNQVSDWMDLLGLERQIQSLKKLILNDNCLPSIFFRDRGPSDTREGFFSSLCTLSLSRNLISQWSSVTCLASLDALVDLRFMGNPLLRDEPSFTARQLLISHLGQITCLNGSNVSSRERQLAERYYVKRYAREWVVSGTSNSARERFLVEHPRFPKLIDTHGLPEEDLLANTPAASTLKHDLIHVTIRCPDHPETKTINKRLPASMTVQKLKGLLQRVYRVDSSDQTLSFLDNKGAQEFRLNDDLKQLSFFSMESGDTILLRW